MIEKPAFWQMDRCGEHGNITLSNGQRLPNIYSKDAALAVVETLKELGRISDEEALILAGMIEKSPLRQRILHGEAISAFTELDDVAQQRNRSLRRERAARNN